MAPAPAPAPAGRASAQALPRTTREDPPPYTDRELIALGLAYHDVARGCMVFSDNPAEYLYPRFPQRCYTVAYQVLGADPGTALPQQGGATLNTAMIRFAYELLRAHRDGHPGAPSAAPADLTVRVTLTDPCALHARRSEPVSITVTLAQYLQSGYQDARTAHDAAGCAGCSLLVTRCHAWTHAGSGLR